MKHIYPGNVLGGSALYLGLSLGDILYYTTNDTFTKADFPGLRAVIPECCGGGGAGGGAVATGASQMSAGGGGSGAGYARSLVLATDLDDTEAITVGDGGTGNSGAAGSNGGDSIFDTISGEVRGKGGIGGSTGSAQTTFFLVLGAVAQTANVGDLTIHGTPGDKGTYARIDANIRGGGIGGSSFLGGGANPNSGNADAPDCTSIGGGGAGASNGQSQSARTGGDGGKGIVIVSLLY